MSDILVTGGAGYIGSVLVPSLLAKGHRVTVLDNFYFNQLTLMDCCANENFSIIRGDARDEETLKRAADGKEFLLPLAALVGFPLCEADKIAATTTNLEAIERLLNIRDKAQKVIFPCTNSGYGIGKGDTLCTEDTPMNPISLYGFTKVRAEKSVLEAGNSMTFRFATLFGASPRMRIDLLLNDFVYRAVHDRTAVIFEGHFKRNFLHVRDAVGAFEFAIEHFDDLRGCPYNCGRSDANVSKLELCAKIKEHLPSFVYLEAPIGTDPDKRDYIVSNARFEAAGWSARYSLDDGIRELIKVYAVLKHKAYANI
jgi:nucleoside-diphosphate-sugar epimerase